MRFCSLEGRNFPAIEFHEDPHWGQIHRTARPHTVTGTVINPRKGGTPVVNVPARSPQP